VRRHAELAHRAGQAAAARAKLGIGTAPVLAHNGSGSGGDGEGSAEWLGECVRRARLQTQEQGASSFLPVPAGQEYRRLLILSTLTASRRDVMAKGPLGAWPEVARFV
jgi:hypothetical protein